MAHEQLHNYWERRGSAIYTANDTEPGMAKLVVDLYPANWQVVDMVVDAHNKVLEGLPK